jgi:methylisocitrate lyase
MPSPQQVLRNMLRQGQTIVAPGAYDPMSARVVQALGFPAIYTGGYVTGAHTTITEPLLTLKEQQVAEIRTQVEALIDLPEYYQLEAETTERPR